MFNVFKFINLEISDEKVFCRALMVSNVIKHSLWDKEER